MSDPIICDHIRKEIKRLEGDALIYEGNAAIQFEDYRESRAKVREHRKKIRALKMALKGFGAVEAGK